MSLVISIIIPVYNEAQNLKRLEPFFKHALVNLNVEIIIVDGGSTDDSFEICKSFGLHVLKAPQKGRAAQMNFGACIAKGNMLYFVHADVTPANDFYKHLVEAINANVDFGCYRYNFDSPSKLLKFNAYMTQFNGSWAGGGDQTLFIKTNVFKALKGFNDDCIIMEDFDLVKRAKKQGYVFKVLQYPIIVSARKYINNSWLKVQAANAIILLAWKCGASQQWMKRKYISWLK